MRMPLLAVVIGASLAGVAPAGAAPPPETRIVPTFGEVTVYAPEGAPSQVVLFVSGDGGWNFGVVDMAEQVRDLGALVVGINIRTFLKSLQASTGCAYPAGSLEELSRGIQLEHHLPAYKRPILVGYSSGATLVYAALAAAPAETFAGAISLGFCPDLDFAAPLCQLRGLRATKRAKGIGYDLAPFPGLRRPWMVLQGEADQVCSPDTTRAFVSATGPAARLISLPKVGHGFGVPRHWAAQFVQAYRDLVKAGEPDAVPPPSVPGVEDLGLVEVPAPGGPHRDEMAVVLTGDGGWAELDRSVAEGLASAGVPVVGWSSLRYFWAPRTPDGAATDLARIVTHYSRSWNKSRVRLIGYSFGADVLPFLVTRLPEAVRARVSRVTLLGLSAEAAFEFHAASWLGGGDDPRYPTKPEVARLRVPVTCVRGADENDSGCLSLDPARVHLASVGQGHHFSGDYARLVELALQ